MIVSHRCTYDQFRGPAPNSDTRPAFQGRLGSGLGGRVTAFILTHIPSITSALGDICHQ